MYMGKLGDLFGQSSHAHSLFHLQRIPQSTLEQALLNHAAFEALYLPSLVFYTYFLSEWLIQTRAHSHHRTYILSLAQAHRLW